MEGSRVPSVFLEETVREGFFFAYSITHPDSRAPTANGSKFVSVSSEILSEDV
jgi:hypothetical protein